MSTFPVHISSPSRLRSRATPNKTCNQTPNSAQINTLADKTNRASSNFSETKIETDAI
ncbi:hypothetical protein ACFQHW_03240 [Lapidilactobacillus achengensis]|uniref:Uncharacterized protein n=1 Tax=Lapidilactobacillus achengensis TaxID=2486000 RepID=A0ABW1UND1_9LACO|nr:hypothetical protein [Lapidilactobacillus achengensis]